MPPRGAMHAARPVATSVANLRRETQRSSRIAVVHAAVPGRLRCRVRGLHRNRRFRITLEQTLPHIRGIERAAISDLTGCIVVFHAPTMNVRTVVGLLERAVAESTAAGGVPTREAVAAARQEAPRSLERW